MTYAIGSRAGSPNFPARCVKTVSKLYLFWWLSLAFERKTDAPVIVNEHKRKEAVEGLGLSRELAKHLRSVGALIRICSSSMYLYSRIYSRLATRATRLGPEADCPFRSRWRI